MKTQQSEQNKRLTAKKEKELRELRKLERIQAKPQPKHYFAILLVVIGIVYIIDEIATNINSAMQPQILFDLFHITSRDVNDILYKEALEKLTVLTVVSGLFVVISPFYKSLADRLGRRPFMAINTCAFGLGLLVIMLSPNVFAYIIGVNILAFVTPNDVQIMYIMEVAPKQHRAKLCSMTKAIALMSVSLIGVLRNVFLNDSDPSSWRMVYLIPVIVAVIVGILSIFFVRETPVFLHQRIGYLRMTDAEREEKARKEKEAKSASKGGVFHAIKYIFVHKQTRYAAIVIIFFALSLAFNNFYSTIMTGAMPTEAVDLAIFLLPFANGIITFFSGFLSDKIGRKKSCLVFGSFGLAMLTLFLLACKLQFGPIVVGISYGMALGFLLSMQDAVLITIPSESVPTNIRSSVMGVMCMAYGLGSVIGQFSVLGLQKYFDIGWLCLAFCVPFLFLSLLILFTKVKETKDADLDTVSAASWE